MNRTFFTRATKYFCKTSGTTSGTKYIPITEDSLPNHLNSARNAFAYQIAVQVTPSLLVAR